MSNIINSLIFFCYLTSNFAAADNTQLNSTNSENEITWLIEDTYEWENYQKNISSSTSKDTAAIIMKGLDEMGYKLSFVKATGKRVNRFLSDTPNACISNRIKTSAREKFSFYSLPHDIYLGLKLYRRSQITPLSPKALNSLGEVISLASLFEQHPEQVLAVSSGISYGNAIDKQLKSVNKKNLFERSGGSRLKSLAEMFFKGRIDYVIFYPTDMDSIVNKSIAIESYPIANTSPYILGHVTCSKTATGAIIINDINKILKQAYTEPEFYHAHEKWLPTSDLPTLRKYYLSVFGQLSKNENIKKIL